MTALAIGPEFDDRILSLIAQLSTIPASEIKPGDRLREDLGLDSVSSMELLSLIAEDLNLDIEVEEAIGVTTVDATIAMARKHQAARAGR